MATGEDPKGNVAGEEVSTGNTATAVDTAIGTIDRKVDSNSFLVTVDQLDTDHFANVRTKMNPDRVAELRQSIKDQGQIQNISVTPLQNGKLAVYAGYTRTEAITQNVCDPLIRKWNTENDLKSSDPNFLVVSNLTHRKMVIAHYAEEFAKEKAKEHNLVRVVVDEEVKNAGQGRLKGFVENFHREDLSLADTMEAIEKLIEVDEISAQNVARMIKRSPGQISQYRKAVKLEPVLREFLVTPEEGETFDESDLAKLKEDVNTLLTEYNRRISIGKKDKDGELGIGLSHVREFAARVVPGRGDDKVEGWKPALTRPQALALLCHLVGADEKKHTLRTGVAPMNYGMFLGMMKGYEDVTKKKREGKETPEEVAAEAAAEDAAALEAATEAAASGAATGTVEGLAAQQAATTATVSSGNTPETAAAANADATVKPSTDKDAEKLAAELVGGEVTDTDSDEPLAPTDGATNRKTQTAPIQAAKVKEANVILAAVNAFVQQAQEPEDVELTPFLGVQAGALQAAQIGFDMLSMDNLARKMQKSSTEFAESLEAYVVALEEYAERAAKNGKVPPFTMERPTPVLPVELAATKAPEDDDEEGDVDEDGEGDELEDPNDEDLAELEGLTDGNME